MSGILEGLRIVEGSAFVAAPLAGMTLAQLGADVIRFDRLEGGLDHHRWPVTKEGRSLFWAGMNKGKRSIAVDLAHPQGQEVVRKLICDAGIFLTNVRSRGWLSYSELSKHRPDLIMVTVLGDRHGGPAVDYTVNPAVGFPYVTGPEGSSDPVCHVLPAWDCITGQMAALAILAADRHRQKTGQGQLIELALKDVAAAMLGHLGIIGEVTINGYDRPKFGNSLYGGYAQDFVCADGERVMVVALTLRQWDVLLTATGLAEDFKTIGRDLSKEGERFAARREITEIFAPWFASRAVKDLAQTFTANGVTWSQFHSFKHAVEDDPDLSPANPIFTALDQPGIGQYVVPGTPLAFGAIPRQAPRPAPILGQHTRAILREIGYDESAIAGLLSSNVVMSSS